VPRSYPLHTKSLLGGLLPLCGQTPPQTAAALFPRVGRSCPRRQRQWTWPPQPPKPIAAAGTRGSRPLPRWWQLYGVAPTVVRAAASDATKTLGSRQQNEGTLTVVWNHL